MSALEAQAPCPTCGADSYNYCVCREADIVEAALEGSAFTAAAKLIRRLGITDLRRLVSTLQYRADGRGYDRGLTDGEARRGEGHGG